MTWYAAHIIIGIVSDDPDIRITAYENIVLLEAESFEDAEELAKKIGQEDASLDDDLTVGGAPARRIFSGVRKILTISNYTGNQDKEPPSHRSEISYSEFTLNGLNDLENLGSGKDVTLTYNR